MIQAAPAEASDAILICHGYFWKGDVPCLTGTRRARIALLIAYELDLFACHLPLGAFAPQVKHRLGRELLVIGDVARDAGNIAWCAGSSTFPIRYELTIRAGSG